MEKSKNLYGVIFQSLGEAAVELKKQIEQNTYNKPRFYVAANLLFGEKLLNEWSKTGHPLDCIKKALDDNTQIFCDADETGMCFLSRMLTLGIVGAFVNESGEKIGKVTFDENGTPDMHLEDDDIDIVLHTMQVSELVFYTCAKTIQRNKEGGESA